MRLTTAALAGAGAAIGVCFAIWPALVLVANLPVIRDLGLATEATEILWGLPFGALAGAAAFYFGGLALRQPWPTPAFASLLIWTVVLALLVGLRAVPPVFSVTSALVAFATTAVIASRTRLPVAPGLMRAILAGCGGFSVFVIGFVVVLVAASHSRPAGVGFAEWRRYMDSVDVLGVAAVALGAGAALALAMLSERRIVTGVVSVLAFGILFLVTAPWLGFLSACYADVLLIFRWLGSPRCSLPRDCGVYTRTM